MSAAASIAARVAGAVTALGFALGLVDGPIVAVVGALSLVAFGRSLAAPAGTELLGPLAFAVVAGAAGVVALRWDSLDLPAIRGIQGVLGPTIAVDPPIAAVAAVAALAASVIAAGVWLADDLAGAGLGRSWQWVEVVAVCFVLATLFVGPAAAGAAEIALWLGATAALTVVTAGIRRVGRGLSPHAALLVVAVAGCLVAGGAGVIGGSA